MTRISINFTKYYFETNLEQLLSEMFFVELSELPQAKTTEVGEEYPAFLLNLTLKYDQSINQE